MAGRTYKTEGVVLRSMRYGEADRILHIYTEQRGKVGAIAKGVRRTKSRFGGRLELFCRVGLVLHQGRGDLSTVTQAATLNAHPRVRADIAAFDAAACGADAVLRVLADGQPNPAVYNLLCRYLDLVDRSTKDSSGSRSDSYWRALALVFRLKLLLATGFAPQFKSCSGCEQDGPLVAFSAREGGMVCGQCSQGSAPFDEQSLRFVESALSLPITASSEGEPSTFRQVDRAVRETLSYHAQVELAPLT